MNADAQAVTFSGSQITVLAAAGRRFELAPMSAYARAEVIVATDRDTRSQ